MGRLKLSKRINLLRKFDIRPNVKTYIPKDDKSYFFNFLMDTVSVSAVSIYASIILTICIVLFYFIILSLIIRALHFISINLSNDYNIVSAVIGIISLFVFSYLSHKTSNIKQRTLFSFLGFLFYALLTVGLISDYFLSKIDTDLEEGIIYMIIIVCTYFLVVSIIYSLIYLYQNNKSYYFHTKTKLTTKMIYIIFYFIFTLLPILIIYILYFNTPVMLLVICISIICALFLFLMALVLLNISLR